MLTTVFTGGAGAAAKGGAVARTVGALGRTARLVDPMTYLGKAAKFGTVKVSDLFANLRTVNAGAYADLASGAGRVQPDGTVVRVTDDTPVIHDNVVEWPDGTRLNLDDGTVVRADGTAAPAKVELSAADRELLEGLARHDPAPVHAHAGEPGVAAATGESAAGGGAGTPRATPTGAADSTAPRTRELPPTSHRSSSGSGPESLAHGDGPSSRPELSHADAHSHGEAHDYGTGGQPHPDANHPGTDPGDNPDATSHGDSPVHSVSDYLDGLSRERGAAYRQAKEAGVFPRRQTGACVGSVIDLRTGRVVEGINGKPDDVIPSDKLHPTLASRHESIRSNPPHMDHPLGHTEVKAANALLWD
ncbi:hypothetical protein [Streptomyces pseudogriseolus]|uniref:hypothetical protein n=1 Tax=Streptomyces pseudogriseolus TaxID=36817 RepID=UPI0034919C38